jgi:hypothetical protein
MTKAENTPNKITEPASLNILPPTPRTNPSVRCSIHAAITELPNPVTGTAVPAPANCPKRSYIPNPVSNMEMKMRVATVGLPAERSVKSKYVM